MTMTQLLLVSLAFYCWGFAVGLGLDVLFGWLDTSYEDVVDLSGFEDEGRAWWFEQEPSFPARVGLGPQTLPPDHPFYAEQQYKARSKGV